ncbi:aromatic acid exporter family protein [Facklamia sp. 7083-14-GEN3]|uniref:FUSC family protein n=1 Tax=Facklamia sp. 7083-14-GEN3 TaxID=2973478 RepID=UPI00215BA0B7|nr:aromatic acid exporter family protein [Facklamia sp. 7083-14-GEN3]MCR8968870.1 aromatic acid exporter family protein [Facklamia sp. 7083-14-GEN3]
MVFSKSPVGMRTFKTAIAVFICILFSFYVLKISPMLSCIAAIFSLRQDLESSYIFGKARIIGVLLSGAVALLFIYLFPISSSQDEILIGLVPIAIILYITIASRIHLQKGIITGCATMLVIFFNIPVNNQLSYTLIRLFSTVMGVVVALIINYLLPSSSDKDY